MLYRQDSCNSMLEPKRSLRRRRQTLSNTDIEREKGRWTEAEKEVLWKALQKYGYEDLKRISAKVTTRSEMEVLFAIRYWKRTAVTLNTKALRIAEMHARKYAPKRIHNAVKKKEHTDMLMTIEAWIEFFHKKLQRTRSEGAYAFSNIFLLIAEFEAHPTVQEASGLDFRELYLWLNDLINGRPMKKLSGVMMKFILDTFNELSEMSTDSKLLFQVTHINRLISHSWKPTGVKTYSKGSIDDGKRDNFMNDLISLPDLNPLKFEINDSIRKSFNMC